MGQSKKASTGPCLESVDAQYERQKVCLVVSGSLPDVTPLDYSTFALAGVATIVM